ncbi:TPA: hypothetical protein ACIS02_004472, partial [Salmonella enterica subsp. enterica serovar Birkenhead]
AATRLNVTIVRASFQNQQCKDIIIFILSLHCKSIKGVAIPANAGIIKSSKGKWFLFLPKPKLGGSSR